VLEIIKKISEKHWCHVGASECPFTTSLTIIHAMPKAKGGRTFNFFVTYLTIGWRLHKSVETSYF